MMGRLVRKKIACLATVALNLGAPGGLCAPILPGATRPVKPVLTTSKLDNWTLICSQTKSCIASLSVAGSDAKLVILNWQIGYGADNKLFNMFSIPPSLAFRNSENKISVGISTNKGFDLRIGSKIRHLNFDGCTAQACSSVLQVDEDFIKDSANSIASATLYAMDGSTLPVSFPIGGMDKVLPAVMKKTP